MMAAKNDHQIKLRAGVYAPIVTIFKDDGSEDLDLTAQARHTVKLAKAGLTGLVVLGSNGEAVHLNRSERNDVIRTTRTALDYASFSDFPIIAGCSAQSVRESVELTKDAAAAGASHAIILPPCYYRPAMTEVVIEAFFKDIADKSPLPILMYNYPGAVAGVDMSSDLMSRIAIHPNVTGAKLTCANTGKLTRLAAATKSIQGQNYNSGFFAAGGLADMEVQTYVSHGSGVIVGTANVFPELCVQVWDAAVGGSIEKAMKLQQNLAAIDWAISSSGIAGTKGVMNNLLGYGGRPRRPLQPLSKEKEEEIVGQLKHFVISEEDYGTK